jgi:biotin synthase-like enzyme
MQLIEVGKIYRHYKGNIYKIISEDDNQIILESDAIDDEIYSVQRSDLNIDCFIYICNGRINENCKYCKYLNVYSQNHFCGNVERSNPNEQGLLQGFTSDYSETI